MMPLQAIERAKSPEALGRMRKVPVGLPLSRRSASMRLQSARNQVVSSACESSASAIAIFGSVQASKPSSISFLIWGYFTPRLSNHLLKAGKNKLVMVNYVHGFV